MTQFELPKDDIGNTDNFATIPDVSLDAIADRVIPRNVQSGVSRGTEQILVDSTGLPKVLSGNQKTFGLGFYVAKPTKNVTTITNASDFIFNSNQNVFKIVYSGTVTLPATTNGSVNTVTYTHNLGYVPAVVAYIASGGANSNIPSIALQIGGANDGKVLTVINSNADSTQVVFSCYNATFSTTTTAAPIKFFLLQETAT